MSVIDTAIIAVADRDQAEVREALSAGRPDLRLVGAEAAGVSMKSAALIAFTPPQGPARFADVPWVHCAGAGADRLLSGLGFRPPLMTRTVGRMGRQIGEYVAGYLLANLQKMAVRRANQAARVWDKEACLSGHAFEQRALVLGTGGIGAGVAATLGALGVAVDGVSRLGAAAAPFGEVFAADALPGDLSAYGALVCALPATPATRGFVDAGLLARFEGALFLSVGRGRTVDADAVARAIQKGRLRGAVLDVFEEEPLPADSPLWAAPGVTVTPHVSGTTLPGDIAEAFLAALSAIERGEPPPLIVDQARGY